MRTQLDTSVLIGELPPSEEVEAAISVVSITELHDEDARAGRIARLAVLEATFDPPPVSVEVARVWEEFAAAVARHGGNPRRRQIDLAIAATAQVQAVPFLTEAVGNFRIINAWSTLGDPGTCRCYSKPSWTHRAVQP